MSLVVLPVAVAWACAPQSASLAFDRDSYKAADAVGLIGSGFSPNTPVALTLQPPSGAAQTVDARAQTNSQGYFETSFALPPDAPPGDYVLQATTNTITARDTFEVVAQSEVVPTPLTPQPPPAPPAPTTPADQPTDTKAARRRAIAKCKKRHRARASMSAAKKRKLARKRAACLRSVKKKYP